jgi:hypothetical protein
MKAMISMLLTVSILTACNTHSDKQEAALKAQQRTIDSMKIAMEKQAIVDSMNNIIAEQREHEKWEEISKNEATSHNKAVATAPAPAPAKKRWSHTAKGALVGAGTGAITGAIVNKKRGEGALIGSVIGAGVGAGTGAIVDHTKKKRQQQQQQ